MPNPKSVSASPKVAKGHASYPPMLKQMEVLGYVKDVKVPDDSRDIGVPFHFYGKTYLIFGDTFCKDFEGNYIKTVSNTIGLIENPSQPLLSTYLELEGNGVAKAFIPLTKEEEDLEASGGGRVTLWAFGSGVQLEDGTGRVWYQKSIDHGSNNLEYIGTGLVKVTHVPHRQPRVERMEGLLFGPDEPRNGTFSTIIEDKFCYLYGDKGDDNIILARIHKDHQVEYAAYEYWDGKKYVADWHEATTVFEGFGQGKVVRTHLFGAKKPFVFVGVTKYGDSKVMLGASERLEGPWSLTPIADATGIDVPGGFRYCMYPQIWASDVAKSELTVTWSEQWPGGVILARLKLDSTAKKDGEA